MNRFVILTACMWAGLTAAVWSADGINYSEHVWNLKRISGTAWIESLDHEPMLIRRNRKLYPGQTLRTDTRTRLQLTRGKERIQVGSSTVYGPSGISASETR